MLFKGGNDMPDSEKINSPFGDHRAALDPGDRNVQRTAKQGKHEQGKNEIGADAQALIGVTNDSYLDEQEEKEQEEQTADEEQEGDGKKDEGAHRKCRLSRR